MRPGLPTRRTGTTTMVLAATVVAVAIGATVIAQSGEDNAPDPPPGVPIGREAEVAGEIVNTGGNTFDPTILTKFIPGHGFVPFQSDGVNADLANYDITGSCVAANSSAGSGGVDLELRAPVELPDGARIKQITYFGRNDSPTDVITVRLLKTTANVPVVVGPSVTLTDSTVDAFTVPAASGPVALSGADNLAELAGSRSVSVVAGTDHAFHNIRVRLKNAADTLQEVCGVEVAYQVPAGGQNDVIQFTALDEPIRVFDSRKTGGGGPLAPNQVRTVTVTDALNDDNTVMTADVVPASATSVTYNITIAGPTGPNFAAVTPASASGFTTSAVNFNGTSDIANAGTVSISSGDVKVWAGNQAGSFQFIMDVTGYFAPKDITLPNMGN